MRRFDPDELRGVSTEFDLPKGLAAQGFGVAAAAS